jgi:GNAT superfamily N-acetyltransferase
VVNAPKDATTDLLLRRAISADRPAIIELCRQSLGWKADDPNEAFFEWKHDENPFGPSPTWVAEDGTRSLVGLRTFLRWRFRRSDDTTINAVRAVDTATHPDWQGRGIFSRLTLGALDDLRDDGADCVFNTPNDKSRPGYLKMGWHQVGKVPVSVRLTGPGSIPKLAGARTAAEMWSEESSVGLPVDEVLADHDAVAALLARIDPGSNITTDRTPEFLHWRYRFAPLRYRAINLGSRPRGWPGDLPGSTPRYSDRGNDLRGACPEGSIDEAGMEGAQELGHRLPAQGLDCARGTDARHRSSPRLRARTGSGSDPHLASGSYRSVPTMEQLALGTG